MRRVVLTVIVLVGLAAPVSAQRLGWDQQGPSLAEVSGYTYRVSWDGGPPTVVVPTCDGTASPFLCTIPITLPTGTHTAIVSAAFTATSPQNSSPALTFNQVPTMPSAPGGLRYIPPQGVTLEGVVLRRYPFAGMDVAEARLDIGAMFYFGAPTGLSSGGYAVTPGYAGEPK